MADEKITIGVGLEEDRNSVKKTFDSIEDKAGQSGQRAGKKLGDNLTKASSAGFRRLGSLAAAAAAAIGSALAGREIIRASAQQQQAINDLNSSLVRIGEFSKDTSAELQNFASNLQSVTKFGDEAILSQLSFAQGLGATAEQSKQIVSAAADLSAALNIDLNAAVRNVGRTLGGFSGELGEVIPELKNLTAEQLRSGAAIDLLAKKFQGLAEREVNTFNGRLAQLRNSFGDVLERIGNIITQSPTVVKGIRLLTTTFDALATRLSSLAERDFIGDVVRQVAQLIRTLAPLGNAFQFVFRQAQFLGSFIGNVFTQQLRIATSFVNNFGGIFNSLGQTLFGTAQNIGGAVFQVVKNTFSAISNLFSFLSPVLNKIKEFGGSVLEALGGGDLVSAVASFGSDASAALNETIIKTGQDFRQIFEPLSLEEDLLASAEALYNFADQTEPVFEQIFQTGQAAITKTREAVTQNVLDVSKTISTALARGISRSIQFVVQNLQNGENAFSNFGKFVLGLLGDLAIQVGETAIAFGITIAAIQTLAPAGVIIAAGAALIAIGSLLKGLSGGAGGFAGAGPAGDTGGGFSGTSQFGGFGPEGEEDRQPQTQVAVNIQGDVLDSEDTGLRIVQLIQSAVQDQDALVVTQAV